MSFRGWPAEALEFYEGLEADNTKTYWHAHKAEYESIVKGPMLELLAELAPEFGEGRIFRPNRDIRFSNDKSPYKTNCAATLTGGGYVSFSSNGLAAGTGYYGMEPAQLDRYRKAVVDDATGPQLEAVAATLRKGGIEVQGRDELKTAPKGYPKDHPRIELLRYKGLIAWKQWPVAAWLGTKKAKDKVADFLRTSQPLNDWLDKNVGREAS